MKERVRQLGLGTMQLTGAGVWGPPSDWQGSIDLLRLAYANGVRLFDTAWYYGPLVTHRLLLEAFSPFPDDLIVITKIGNSRTPARDWRPALELDELRTAFQSDRKHLKLDTLPMTLLRWAPQEGDDKSFARAFALLGQFQNGGMVREIGVSNVKLRHLKVACSIAAVSAVSNAFSIGSRWDADVLQFCAEAGIAYYPYYPLLGGDLVRNSEIARVARAERITPAQVALAWLFDQSPVIVPIPGTRNARHLAEILQARTIRLDPTHLDYLNSYDPILRG